MYLERKKGKLGPAGSFMGKGGSQEKAGYISCFCKAEGYGLRSLPGSHMKILNKSLVCHIRFLTTQLNACFYDLGVNEQKTNTSNGTYCDNFFKNYSRPSPNPLFFYILQRRFGQI